MLASELRKRYIDFFKEKGHLHLPGAPLVPIDVLGVEDTSTLFTSAGMNQFKPYFTGEAKPPNGRIATVQKCMRTVDIDEVGDYSHCTFFEMLGNFSFGDYFKAEVIPWTWEFLTVRLGLDPDKICVTVFYEDDEAFEIWRDSVGLPESRIHRLGEDKNFWPANAIAEGPDGPCGPCSELYFWVGTDEEWAAKESSTLTPTEQFKVDDGAKRWLELWNNVFTQFSRSTDEHGKPILTPLPQKNNDTGAGFDRIVQMIQGKRSVFETDLFQPILSEVERLSGKQYGGTMEPVDFAFRVVAEHTRCMTFCIADGVTPSNEGRGYVLRRIMRRAIRFGKTALGFDEPFLHQVAPKVIEQMGDFYPELVARRAHIVATIREEEDRFLRTLESGLRRVGEALEGLEAGSVLSGRTAFTLYTTYGFPLELTQEIAAERGVTVNDEEFGRLMIQHGEVSKGSGATGRAVFQSLGAALAELQKTQPPTEFVGYGETVAEAKIVAIIQGTDLVDSARAGDEVEIVLDRTPFYAESGGQVGDTGVLTTGAGDTSCAVRVRVTDTQKAGGIFLHKATIDEGEATVGQVVTAAADGTRRRHIMRNHTATHLLHAALRQVLGEHVHQKGSLVAPDRLRFDFTHTAPMSPDEVRRVEAIVNERALDDAPVRIYADIPIDEARARGAMALFGEKYGDRVRMVEIPSFSLELCGGTHLGHTSQVGLFKIVSEGGVAAGVRRIEAVTGAGAYALINQREETIERVAEALRTSPRDLLTAAERLREERAQLERQVKLLRAGAAEGSAELQQSEVAGVAVVTGRAPSADNEALAALADRAAKERGSAVIVVAGAADGRVGFAAKVTPDLVKLGFHAGNLVREVAKIAGGGGGGRPDFAQAGGREASKLAEALAAVPGLVEQQAKANAGPGV